MKKFLVLLITVIAMYTSVQAQTVLTRNKYIWSYTGLSTDTVTTGVGTLSKYVVLNKPDGFFYTVKVKVSDSSAGATGTIKLQGKQFAADNYTDITTITWHGGGTDTTAIFQNISSKLYWRYLKVLVTPTANRIKLTSIDMSLRK